MNELNLQANQPASLWHDSPSLVHLLGLSPLLAVTDSLVNAVALGVATLVTAVASAAAVYGLAPLIAARWRYLCYSIILAVLVSLLMQLLQWHWAPLSRQLGIYPALIACNFALLLQMDRCKNAASAVSVLLDASRLGLGLLLALLVLASVRELLLYGSVFNGWLLLLPGDTAISTATPQAVEWMRFARLQPAAFMLLALLIALANWTRILRPAPLQNRSPAAVERARVSGVLKTRIKEDARDSDTEGSDQEL